MAVAYLGGKVDVGSSVEQQLGNTHVLIVSCYVQWCEARLDTRTETRSIARSEKSSGPRTMDKVQAEVWTEFRNKAKLEVRVKFRNKVVVKIRAKNKVRFS